MVCSAVLFTGSGVHFLHIRGTQNHRTSEALAARSVWNIERLSRCPAERSTSIVVTFCLGPENYHLLLKLQLPSAQQGLQLAGPSEHLINHRTCTAAGQLYCTKPTCTSFCAKDTGGTIACRLDGGSNQQAWWT